MDKRFSLVINFKDGSSIRLIVREKIPATSGNNLLMWADIDGSFYMANELEVQYIECTPVLATE